MTLKRLLGFTLCIAMASGHVFAQTLDWGASGSGTASGGTGNWNTSSALWATHNTSTYQAWPNTSAIALFGGTAGTVTLTTNITTGGLTFNSGNYVINSSGGNTLSLINDGSGNAPAITLNAGQTTTINAPIATPDNQLAVMGPGTLILGGASPTVSGFIYFTGGGTIKLTATSSLGSPTINFGDSSSPPGGTVIYDNTGATGATTQTFQANVYSGENTIQSTRGTAQNMTLDLGGMPVFTGFSGTMNLVVSGGTNGVDNKILGGSFFTGYNYEGLFFNGSNYAYNTGTFIRGINYGVDSSSYTTGAATSISTTNGQNKNVQITGSISQQVTNKFTTLNINGAADMTLATGATVTTNGILKSGTGASTISGGTALKAGINAQIIIRTDLASDSLTISTPMIDSTAGTSALIKSGAGTLKMTAVNTYKGQTFVNAGTLLVNNTTGVGLGRASTGQVYVQTGATLGGHGTIGGATEIENGATLSPSASSNGAGTLTFNTGLQVDAGSTLTLNLGTQQDKIRVSGGGFNFSGLGTLTLNLTDIAGYVPTQSYTLVDWTGTTSNITLADFTLGSTPAGSAGQLAIVNNTLVLQATASVPEPSTVLLLLLGAFGLVGYQVRRQKQA